MIPFFFFLLERENREIQRTIVFLISNGFELMNFNIFSKNKNVLRGRSENEAPTHPL